MIACDNPRGCPIKWYHMECLQMDDVPEGKWLCSFCKGVHIETCTYFKVFFKVIGRFQMKRIFNSIVLSSDV